MKKSSKPFATLCKVHSKAGHYGYSVPLSKDVYITSVNGTNVLVTKRDYYLDTKQDKVRYQTMSVENSSVKFYVDVYSEISPGMFVFHAIATDHTLSMIIDRAAKFADNIKIDRPDYIDFWLDDVKLYN